MRPDLRKAENSGAPPIRTGPDASRRIMPAGAGCRKLTMLNLSSSTGTPSRVAFAWVYPVPGSSDGHATWNTTGTPTVLVLSLVTLNGHQCGPNIRYTPSGGVTWVGATGRASWPTPPAITEAMAARTRHASKTLETQRRRAGRLAPNCTRSSGPPPGSVMADNCTSRAAGHPSGECAACPCAGRPSRLSATALHGSWSSFHQAACGDGAAADAAGDGQVAAVDFVLVDVAEGAADAEPDCRGSWRSGRRR